MSGGGARRVLITRSEDDCAAWSAALAERGAVAIALPCIRTERIDSEVTRQALRAGLAEADWLVLTSRRGVEAVADLCADLCREGLPDTLRVAVVGRATGEAARELLGRADLVGTGGTGAKLADALIEAIGRNSDAKHATNVLLALAETAADTIETKLAASSATGSGIDVRRINVYRTVPSPVAAHKRAYSSLGSDTVFLASPSAASGFMNQVEMDTEPAIVTIGPSTSAAARRLGLRVSAEAAEPSLDGLLEAMQCLS